MSSAEKALAQNAAAVPPVGGGTNVRINGRKVLSLQQQDVVADFVESYNLAQEDIFFDGDDPEPYFSYEALSLLTLILSPEIGSIESSPVETDIAGGVITAKCVVALTDGRTRSASAMALVGEQTPGGYIINDNNQALGVAQSRAARRALSMVGFNVLKLHAAKQSGADLPLMLKAEDPRTVEMREAHAIGGELGWIRSGDKLRWRQEVNAFTKGEFSSMSEMDDKTRSHWVIYLRALKRLAPTQQPQV